MSKRNNKKHKIAEMEGGSREGTPKKLKVFSEFNETFRDTNDVDDNFVVSKNFKDKDSHQLIALSNIPKTWSVESLAKFYKILFEYYENHAFGTPEDTVKALIEVGLTQNATDINNAYRQDFGPQTPEKVSEKSPRDLIGMLVAKMTTIANTGQLSAYKSTTGWTSYDVKPRGGKAKNLARAVMSWLSSYIILHAYGCRKEVQEEFGKMTYKKLRLIWDKNLDQVYKHYTNFFDHEIRASIAFPHGSKKEFEQARFLPKLGEDENHHFFDDYDDLSEERNKSSVSDPNILLKQLVEQVVENAETHTKTVTLQYDKVHKSLNEASMQLELLNVVKGMKCIANHHKKKLEQHIDCVQLVESLYMKYRTKEDLPQGCSFESFLLDIKKKLDLIYESKPDRKNSESEIFEKDLVNVRLVHGIKYLEDDLKLPVTVIHKWVNTDKSNFSVNVGVEKVEKLYDEPAACSSTTALRENLGSQKFDTLPTNILTTSISVSNQTSVDSSATSDDYGSGGHSENAKDMRTPNVSISPVPEPTVLTLGNDTGISDALNNQGSEVLTGEFNQDLPDVDVLFSMPELADTPTGTMTQEFMNYLNDNDMI